MKIIITESQLKSLILEQQKIKVTDKCGNTQEFDYQQWYYNGGQVARSDLKCYTWDGKSYVYNYSCHFKNWTSMTKEQRDTAISGVKKTCVGSYKDQPNLISMGFEELAKFDPTTGSGKLLIDAIMFGLQFFPPVGPIIAKVTSVIYFIYYSIKAYYANDIYNQVTNLISAIFEIIALLAAKIPMPSGLNTLIQRFDNFLGSPIFREVLTGLKSSGELLVDQFATKPKYIQILIMTLVDFVGPKITAYINSFMSSYINPLIAAIDPKKNIPWLSNILNTAKEWLDMIAKLIGVASSLRKKVPAT